MEQLRPGDSFVKDAENRMKLETLVEVTASKETASFRIGAYEVTNLQFSEFIAGGGYTNRSCWSEDGWKWKEAGQITSPRYWSNERLNAPEQPVVGVSWYEAEAYCKWASERSGRRYRLPSAAEWECAAKPPEGADWPWGNDVENPRANLRCSGNDCTLLVGQFKEGKIPAGCYDIIGNAAEWCGSASECYARGGSWRTPLERVKSDSAKPIPAATRLSGIGFRVVCEGE
jgi:formylglycine-generating enzyme required for sulfatase activity